MRGHGSLRRLVPMTNAPFAPVYTRDPRLTPYAASAEPVWLWSTSGPGIPSILWTNAAGADVFGAATVGELIRRGFEPDDPAVTEVVRLAGSLPRGGAPRLERLRGFGTGAVRLPVCACSKITFNDQMPAILVAAKEIVGPPMPLADRVRRLFEGTDQAIAVFSSDGVLLYATPAGHAQIGGARTLADLRADALAHEALQSGWVTGTLPCGRVILDRIGSGAAALVSATFVTREQMTDADGSPDRPPLRFGWHMDAEGRMTLGSPELSELVGATAEAISGRPWNEINTNLALDPAGAIEQAVATRDTFSAIAISWPIEDSDERLTVELSGLPIFDRAQNFIGYRGFGVCRDLQRSVDSGGARRAGPKDKPRPRQESGDGSKPALIPVETPGDDADEKSLPVAATASGQNVVPFRAAASASDKAPSLTLVEHKTFNEIGRQLSTRLENAEREQPPEPPRQDAPSPPAEPAVEDVAHAETPAVKPDGGEDAQALLDQLPLGLLVYDADGLRYANAAFLAAVGQPDITAFKDAGRVGKLLIEPVAGETGDARSLRIETADGEQRRLAAQQLDVPWSGETAHVLILVGASEPAPTTELDDSASRLQALEQELQQIRQQAVGAQERLQQVRQQAEVTQERLQQVQQQAEGTQERLQQVLAESTRWSAKAVRLAGELRSALNAIVGFTEIMLEESFGPIGNERYRAYLSDIRVEGQRVVAALASLEDAGGVEAPIADTIDSPAAAPEHVRDEPEFVTPINADIEGTDAEGLFNEREEEPETGALIEDRDQEPETALLLADPEVPETASSQAPEAASSQEPETAPYEEPETTSVLGDIPEEPEAAPVLGVFFEEPRTPSQRDHPAEAPQHDHLSEAPEVAPPPPEPSDEREAAQLPGDVGEGYAPPTLSVSPVQTADLGSPHRDGIDLHNLVRSCVAELQPEASRTQLLIRTSLFPMALSVNSDARVLRELIVNLLTYALKTTKAGGQVIVSTGSPLDSHGNPGGITLRVRDTGGNLNDSELAATLKPPVEARLQPDSPAAVLAVAKAGARAIGATFGIAGGANNSTVLTITFPARASVGGEGWA
jgi:signal transduction histidine kinase